MVFRLPLSLVPRMVAGLIKGIPRLCAPFVSNFLPEVNSSNIKLSSN